MPDREDLNDTAHTGVVNGRPFKIILGDSFFIEFRLTVSKVLRDGAGRKLSTFKVVLFDKLAAKHEADIESGRALLVKGELDECTFAVDGEVQREIRIVGRFVKVIGAS